MSIAEKITGLRAALPQHVELIAVSKTYPPSAVLEAYRAGQRAFGENRPQELVEKYHALPKDIRWHQIGGLQSNKVKYIAPFVAMIHSVESAKLLDVIQKEAVKNDRTIDVLLEIRIAREASKHGWSEKDLVDYLQTGAYRNLNSVRFRGLMGVAPVRRAQFGGGEQGSDRKIVAAHHQTGDRFQPDRRRTLRRGLR